jgi:hypothetical protein
MKLTSSQFSQIQRQIGLEKIHHLDIKSELADHIACKIESELSHKDEFEKLLQRALTEINPKKFQQQLLIQAHLSSLKELFGTIGNPKILAISIGIAILIGTTMHLIPNPDFFEENLKSGFLIVYSSLFIFGIRKNKSFGNSQILSSLNILVLVASLSHFSIRLDWLQWTGFTSQTLLFSMTAYFSFIVCTGYFILLRKIRKLKTA